LGAKIQKTFGLSKFATNSATEVMADGACGHEAQAVLFADVVEFDCCCHMFLFLLSPCPTGRNLINLFYLRLRLASFKVLRNGLPPLLVSSCTILGR
jgi:hypothetical protein